ncbi:hypothetical protein Glove_393g4 [Diversispora epigaea]|uniref:Uncharacterized protein n=1 Tax=Diversispora epigaea TaxID=1348612 RepID=A0A397H639_9GLOM|nr:hypothetical protein Glove_393g4 [Diversispora epigaea]
MSIFEVCKVPPIYVLPKSQIIWDLGCQNAQITSIWDLGFGISAKNTNCNLGFGIWDFGIWILNLGGSFRKLFDKVEEDEEDTYITRIIKNVWPKKKNIPNLQIAWVISIAEIILNPNNENIKISKEIIKPVLLKNLNKIENNESFEYESNSPERLEVAPKRLAAPKKSAVPERPAAPRSNKRITEIETSRKEKKKIRSIRKDEENDDNDDEADEGNKAYEANEAYETDEGDKYYNEIINIDESEEE